MPRDFFTRPQSGTTPVSGTIISDIQLALNAAGVANLGPDGLYGGQTAAAISTFQQQRGMPASGSVSDVTWTALMRSDAPLIFERCLQVVASFEGTGFTLVVGNFDGAGITWGIIGFTLRNGELGEILSRINQTFPDLIGKALGDQADTIMRISGRSTSPDEKIDFANSISRGKNRMNVAEPWKTAFHDLGSFREVQRIQIERAREIFWTKTAVRDAKDLGLTEELDLLLMYDIAVQNGGMRSKNRLANARAAIQQQNPTTAEAKRKIIASVVADSITSKFKQDVLSRKMSIAQGGGVVHGGRYELSQWGFLDGQSPASV